MLFFVDFRQEGVGFAYIRKMISLKAYDGRNLNGFIYMNRNPGKHEFPPSSRYLGILIKGSDQKQFHNPK